MKCAYCDCEGKMTKEHVIPKGFIKHMQWEKQIITLEKAPSRVINAELMVKDVCADCNNGELSKLDAYALSLFMQCNNKISGTTHKFYFKYKYDFLVRWLLKVCFNSARANSCEFDASLYKENVGYILNQEDARTHICVYAIFLGYDNLGNEFIKACDHLREEREYEFDWFRIGPFKNEKVMTHDSALRAVIINSFAFLVVVTNSDKEYEAIRNQFSGDSKNFCELQRNGKVWLKKDQDFMMETFLSNVEAKECFMRKRKIVEDEFKILMLTRDEIEMEDYSSISWLLETYTANRDILRDTYQRVMIVVEGYDKEEREIYQVPEYQRYFSTVFANYPQIIWLLAISYDKSNPFMAMLWAAVNDNSIDNPHDACKDIYPNKEKYVNLLVGFYHGVNSICHEYVIDESVNKELTEKINEAFSEGLGISL